jgi:hypothetical protein
MPILPASDPSTATVPEMAQQPAQIIPPPQAEQPTGDQPTVANQMTGLLAQDSPWMQAAAGRAAQNMGALGLRNSTLGIQAGQAAAINAALPIAQQDAGHLQNLSQMTHGTNLERGTMGYGDVLQRGQMSHGAELERGTMGVGSELQRGTMTHGSELARQEAEQAATLQRGTLTHGEELARGTMNVADQITRGQMQLADVIKQGQMSHETAQALERAGFSMSGNIQGQYGQHIANIQKGTSDQIAAISMAPGIDAATKETLIKQIQEQADSDLQLIADVYDSLSVWDATWPTLGGITAGTNLENVTP